MNILKNKAGFSAVELVIVLAVVGAFSFIGYMVYDRQQTKDSNSATVVESREATDVPSAPEISSADDLTKAEQTLDSVDVESSSDSAALEQELGTF